MQTFIYWLEEVQHWMTKRLINGRNAWRKLKKWIETRDGLLKKLEDLGYGKSKQPLTPLMVKLIVEAFGEP